MKINNKNSKVLNLGTLSIKCTN